MSELESILATAVVEALDTAEIDAEKLSEMRDNGALGAFIGAMYRHTLSASRWGFEALSAEVSEERRKLLALRAVFKAIHDLTPFVDFAEVAFHALGSFERVDVTPEEIATACFAAAVEMGLEVRSMAAVEMLDASENFLAHLFEIA